MVQTTPSLIAYFGFAAFLLSTLIGRSLAGQPPSAADAIPADVVAAVFFSGPRPARVENGAWSTLKIAAHLADRARQAGLFSKLDAETRTWIDVFTAASTIAEYPYAIALLDIQGLARSDGGHQLSQLRAGLILDTRGANVPIETRIRHLLRAYTSSNDALVSQREDDGRSTFTLRDRSLPAWATITWGAYGDYYVIAIGDGTYERILSTLTGHSRSLARDAWFRRASQISARTMAGSQAQAPNSEHPIANGSERRNERKIVAAHPEPDQSPARRLAWYLNFAELRRTADPSLDLKIQWVQSALGLAGIRRGLWTVGRIPSSGSVETVSVAQRRHRDEVRQRTGDLYRAELMESAIPDLAETYAVIDCDPLAAWNGIAEAFLASKSPRTRESKESLLESLEADAGLSIKRDIVAHLSGPVVIHDYPPHALRLPIAFTLIVRISGDAEDLHRNLDRILSVVQERLAEGDGVQLQHDADGIWFLQCGLVGPALTLTDRWLILGFSPHAVRRNLALIGSDSDDGS